MKTKSWIIVYAAAALIGLIAGYMESIQPAEPIAEPISHLELAYIKWSPPFVPNDLQRAQDDYRWRLDLVREQTIRLDMLYAAKAGVKMERDEYENWLSNVKSSTEEFVNRNRDAEYSGRNVRNLMNKNVYYNRVDYNNAVRYIETINKNIGIGSSDNNIVIDNYNKNVDTYNDRWAK